MSSKNVHSNEGAGNGRTEHEQAYEQERVGERAEQRTGRLALRASVEQEIQAKVDTNHPDATPGGLTLAAEERLEAREWEIGRTRERWDRDQDGNRERACQEMAAETSQARRDDFEKRAASVDPLVDPARPDPREELSRAELGAVNREAMRVAEQVEGWSRAAISRLLAERVVEGTALVSAVVGVFEELQRAPGQVIPIAAVGEVPEYEVSIAGEVVQLWEPRSAAIRQVGLIDDGSARIKFTSWVKSAVPYVEEGEHVVFRVVAKNWYQGRVSVALTGRSDVYVPEREGWWTE